MEGFTPTVCAKSVPAPQNSAKFVNAQQEQGSSQDIDSKNI